MNVGELFVNLGIKGAEKTVGALSSVKKGLGEVGSMSLEAKAGIVGAMYAMERMFASSGAMGTGLTNLNATLSMSSKTLQQYEFAGRQMGITNKEVEGSLTSLQAAMTKTLLHGQAPSGMGRVAEIAGGMDAKDVENYQLHPELLLKKLQEYAQKEKNIGLRNEVLGSFGLNDSMKAGLIRGGFNDDVMKKAPTYSDGDIKALDKANIAWSNLGTKIEMAVGKFNAQHGGQLVKDIGMLVEKVLALATALEKMAEKLHLFEALGKVFDGLAIIMGGVTNFADRVEKNKSGVGEGLKKESLGFLNDIKEVAQGAWLTFTEDHNKNLAAQAAAPNVPAAPGASKTTTNNATVNLHFQHDGKDSKKTADSARKGILDAFNQISAKAGGQ